MALNLEPASGEFPNNMESVSASFTGTCIFLGLNDLHFHYLRNSGSARFRSGMGPTKWFKLGGIPE